MRGKGGGRGGCHRAGQATHTRMVQCGKHTWSVCLRKILRVVWGYAPQEMYTLRLLLRSLDKVALKSNKESR